MSSGQIGEIEGTLAIDKGRGIGGPNRWRHFVVYSFVTIAFISRLIDGFVARIHLVDSALIGTLFLLILSARRVVVPLSWTVCTLSLYIGAMIGLVTPDLQTNFSVMPIILTYRSIGEFIVAVVYESRYIIAMGLFLGCGIRFTTKQRERLVTFMLLLLTVNAIFSIIEYVVPSIHEALMKHAGYVSHYSFVYRGVSLLLNAYDASMSMVFLVALCAYRWIISRQLRYLAIICIGAVATLLLGTRSGYIALLGYGIWLSLTSHVSVGRRLARAAGTLVAVLFVFAVLAIEDRMFQRILISIVLLSDSKGSAQLHVKLFFHTISMIAAHPFGVGLGKTNFGALISGLSYEPESYALSLGLDGGLVALGCFYYYNIKIFRNIQKSSQHGSFAIASLGLTLLSLSWINMQVFGSSFVMTFLPIIAAGFISTEERGAKSVDSEGSAVQFTV